MKILSIDWDYFFPNSEMYDWGENENIFASFEIIWQKRLSDLNRITKKSVLDEYKPTIPTDFWFIISNNPYIFVADSHDYIWNFLNKAEVYSLDAHHDCGYYLNKNKVDCGNWAHHGLSQNKIQQFHL